MTNGNMAIASAMQRAAASNTGASAHQVSATSRDALMALPMTSLKSMADQVHAVVAAACRAGAKDLSMREIQLQLNQSIGKHVDMSSISARVNALVAAKRLVRDADHPRACSITGVSIAPLRLPVVQDRLCA